MSSSSILGSESSTQKNALFIDADPDVHEMLVNILDPSVWSVRHAPDNKTALALAQAAPFDFVVTSEKTPGGEDVDLLRKIRSLRPHTRLIILTDESTPIDVITSMREHAFSYFSKPFTLSSLADMVRAAAEGPCWDQGIEVLSATQEWIRLVATCDLKTADRLMQFMHEVADLPEPESDAVATAFREILMNAIEHGGHFRSDQYVEISYVRAKHMVMCRIKIPARVLVSTKLSMLRLQIRRMTPFATWHIAKLKGCARAAMESSSSKNWSTSLFTTRKVTKFCSLSTSMVRH